MAASTGPHIRDAASVQRLWSYFVIATLPAWLIGLWNLGYQINMAAAQLQAGSLPGWRGAFLEYSGIGLDPMNMTACITHGLLWFLPIFAVALAAASSWEALFATLRRRPRDEGLLAAPWLFALMMPAAVPLYQVALGISFGLVLGKLIYGGSGRYLVNPALLAIAFLVFSYPATFDAGAWVPVAGYDQPTVLELIADEGGLTAIAAADYTGWQLFAGATPGAVGTTSILGILLGALFLTATGVASWRVMLGAVAGLILTVWLFNTLGGDSALFAVPWQWHVVLGGFAFGVVFLATDPVAGAITQPGRWFHGLLVGCLTVLIRNTNPSYYEGVMFAMLLASMLSPLFDFVVIERNAGRRRKRLQEPGT